VLAFLPSLLFAQYPHFITDHTHHIQQLGTAKDSLYKTILSDYERYIANHAADHKAQIERCRFIESAYYDTYEEYNPNYELAEACADTVLIRFPGNPEVLLYGTSFIYGDSLGNYLIDLETKISSDTSAWRDYQWEVYYKLAQHYHDEDEHSKTIRYAELAVAHNDTLDLSLMMAKSYKNLSKNIDALEILQSHIDSTNESWTLNEKGRLLMELGANDKAIEAFRLASRKDSGAQNGSELANAMINNGLIEEARIFLAKEVEASTQWTSSKSLRELFLYDIRYGSADSASVNYRKFEEKEFYNDVFGIYRLRMIAKSPLMGWSLTDGAHLLLLVLLIVCLVIIPYLWILPIHYLGSYLKERGKLFPPPTFEWGLRHFWIACSVWLMSDIVAMLVFDYPGVTALFIQNSYEEETPAISKVVADLDILFCMGLLIVSIALLKRADFEGFFSRIRASASNIGIGIMLALGLKVALGIYISTFRNLGVDFSEGAMITASITDTIKSINKFYNPLLGFLFVVVFAPFYEEILFRGIFLSSCEKNMKWIFANILQASIFALVHQSLIYFPFYFAFGMLAGYYTRKTGSLMTSTSMHMMNNALAFFYLLSMKG
jgi:membrane protease YdiL (CAAX protease family)/tetratricopeptide (TPR) repeat protein